MARDFLANWLLADATNHLTQPRPNIRLRCTGCAFSRRYRARSLARRGAQISRYGVPSNAANCCVNESRLGS